ncbi:GTPase-activating protein [Alteromonas aestuariivivens]|uniref:Der GTPase-activating protein YihI n=1 Tax=Alteromonas aestuariivivens TaxID=1938339 RepID=A0A3D8M566_9ALTE|nr:Der GTPase-activating protein YihI [Alteromonas aestuariivivens]RDV24771.1 GTPase-activating protein [Alteromonas aestuariivivens]
MARSKKTRKVGLIGVRKDPDYRPAPKVSSGRVKKKKGKPAGSRHNVEQPDVQPKASKTKQDPRVGSKKPIELVVTAKRPPQPAMRKYASPADELAALEADERLAELLDKLDANKTLSAAEQAYVDEKMNRHRIVCDLLGITDDEEEESDPFDTLDALNIEDFKH